MKFEAGDFKFGRRRTVAEVEGLNRIVFAEAEALDGAMRDAEQRCEVRVVAVAEQKAVARDEPDEL